MPTFEKCDSSVREMAIELLREFETHQLTRNAGVTIDFVFAFAEKDDNGNPVGPALMHGGYPAGGICRKIPLKDRVLGRADVEISLDGDWWANASYEEQRALLDHELHHIVPKQSGGGAFKHDPAGRPVISIRKHDYQVGWFEVIAARHGVHSAERKQASKMMAESGQYFWPELSPVAQKLVPIPGLTVGKAATASH